MCGWAAPNRQLCLLSRAMPVSLQTGIALIAGRTCGRATALPHLGAAEPQGSFEFCVSRDQKINFPLETRNPKPETGFLETQNPKPETVFLTPNKDRRKIRFVISKQPTVRQRTLTRKHSSSAFIFLSAPKTPNILYSLDINSYNFSDSFLH